MQLNELFLLAFGLAMDAFAVSICKGLSLRKVELKHCATAGIYFGGFQAIMPLIGYMLGIKFQHLIQNIDHWIAFILLLIIGVNMIREAFGDEEESYNDSFSFSTMLPMAIATSIDALAVGITLAFLNANILQAVLLIGIITFIMSAAGVKIGAKFGVKYKSKAEILGGIALIVIGTKILLEHLGILG